MPGEEENVGTLGGAGRSYTRHGSEVSVVGSFVNVAAMLWGQKWLAGVEDPQTRAVAIALLAGGTAGLFANGYKWIHQSGIEAAITERIVRAVKGGAAALALLALAGCAFGGGKVTPKSFTTVGGQTVVACEIEGAWVAFGRSSVCRTMDGGEVSQGATAIVTGTVEAVGRIVAGLFGGLGAGLATMGQAVPAPALPAQAASAPQTDVGYVATPAGGQPAEGFVLPDGSVYEP